jgi:ornithine decarboxylase
MSRKRYRDAAEVAAALKPSYPVFCIAPAAIRRNARSFLDAFPGRVLYAVKCNPHPWVLDALYDAGVHHFDTASLVEIAQIREQFHNRAEAYFMHPVKSRAAIRTAYEVYGIRHYVIDHPAELDKLINATGGEGLAITVRFKTPESKALFNLSAKFGASPELAAELLRRLHTDGQQAGLAFHVGSQCLSPGAYFDALQLAGDIVDAAGVDIHFLDVGGGFPAPYPGPDLRPLDAYLDAINQGLESLRLRKDCVLMCEPGRALVADGASLLAQVLLRKDDEIYINDGVYGCLSEAVNAALRLPARLVRLSGVPCAELREFKVYGPTCDSVDVLPSPFLLPDDVCDGDWVEIGLAGAYSNALATHFNGFSIDTFVEVEEAFGA